MFQVLYTIFCMFFIIKLYSKEIAQEPSITEWAHVLFLYLGKQAQNALKMFIKNEEKWPKRA